MTRDSRVSSKLVWAWKKSIVWRSFGGLTWTCCLRRWCSKQWWRRWIFLMAVVRKTISSRHERGSTRDARMSIWKLMILRLETVSGLRSRRFGRNEMLASFLYRFRLCRCEVLKSCRGGGEAGSPRKLWLSFECKVTSSAILRLQASNYLPSRSGIRIWKSIDGLVLTRHGSFNLKSVCQRTQRCHGMVWHALITFDIRLQMRIVAEEILLSNMRVSTAARTTSRPFPQPASNRSNYHLSI